MGIRFEIEKFPRRRFCRSNFPSSYLFGLLFPGTINWISILWIDSHAINIFIKTEYQSCFRFRTECSYVSLFVWLTLATMPSNTFCLWVDVYVCCEIEMLQKNYRANVGKRKPLIGRRILQMYLPNEKGRKMAGFAFKNTKKDCALSSVSILIFFSSIFDVIKIHWFLLLVCCANTTNAIYILCGFFSCRIFACGAFAYAL